VHYSVAEDGTITMSEEQLASRKAEKRFATSEAESGIKYNGRYTIGTNQEGGVITIADGKVSVYCQANVIDYHFADLVEQAANVCVPFVDKIPETIVYPASVSSYLTSVEEVRESKFNLFVMGKFRDIGGSDFEGAWNAYMTSIESKNLSTLKTVVKETATQYGYTA
jgi:hypothetical protein